MGLGQEELREEFVRIREVYAELVVKGEQFIQEQVYKGWVVGQYVELSDEIRYFIYRNFPELYSNYFQEEPQLPVVSKWYYFLTRAFWIPEKRLNRFLWPQYGNQVVAYMTYYNDTLGKVLQEIGKRLGDFDR